MKSFYRTIYSLLPLLILISSCRTDPEPVSTGHYIIDNRTDLNLQIEMNNTLIEDVVPPEMMFHFHTVEVGTGGSPSPFHNMEQFKISNSQNDSILYEGISIESMQDWELRETRLVSEHPDIEYYLTVSE